MTDDEDRLVYFEKCLTKSCAAMEVRRLSELITPPGNSKALKSPGSASPSGISALIVCPSGFVIQVDRAKPRRDCGLMRGWRRDRHLSGWGGSARVSHIADHPLSKRLTSFCGFPSLTRTAFPNPAARNASVRIVRCPALTRRRRCFLRKCDGGAPRPRIYAGHRLASHYRCQTGWL